MWISKRALIAGTVALIAATSMALAVGAFAHRGGDDRKGDDHGRGQHDAAILAETLAPSVPTDPTFHGVAPGAAPWVLRSGTVSLSKRGRLDLRVRGLVIPNPPGDGTAGPVTTISASLYCGADSDAVATETSKEAPLSSRGNGRIKDRSFDVPDTCLAPVILVHPNGDATHYIALEGWRP